MKKIFLIFIAFAIQIGSAQNIFPLPSGNVGIGTTDPTGILDLRKLNSNIVFDLDTNNFCRIISKGWNANIDMHTFQINGIENLNQFHLNTNGNIGVGTDQPQAKFHIQGDLQNNGNILLGHMGDTNYLTSREVGQILGIRGSQEITFGTYAGINWVDRMIISNSGNVGIGTINPANKLDVNGTIHSKEVKIDMTGWSDFVFKKDYSLPTLQEVEKHIAERGHLENIPSEEEVLKSGINLGEMNAKLLQKIEELTLYIIEQNKKTEELKTFISDQNKVISEQNNRIQKLENKR